MVTGAPISTVETFIARITDRRKRQRVVVQWPVRVWRFHEYILDTHTVNVSSGGFYCICPRLFSLGETLTAVLEIPAVGSDREFQKLMLRCEALVLRVEALADTRKCGIACRILNYSVLRGGGVPLGSEQANLEDGSAPSPSFDGKRESAARGERS